MQKFTPKIMSPLSGGAVASVCSRSDRVIPVFGSMPHWWRPGWEALPSEPWAGRCCPCRPQRAG